MNIYICEILALLSPFRNTIYILYNGTPIPNADEHLAKKNNNNKNFIFGRNILKFIHFWSILYTFVHFSEIPFVSFIEFLGKFVKMLIKFCS